MAKILYTSSHGSDDPTRATIAFVGAIGAIDAGHESELALLGEGPVNRARSLDSVRCYDIRPARRTPPWKSRS
jgi:predicted peroxiredoxin